jgi:hypothetical protein
MKTKLLFGGLILAALFTLTFMINSNALAVGHQKSAASAAASHGTTEYLIEVTHTPEECLKTLDEVKALGPSKLNQWNWGCKYGNHTGYTIVKATSESEALSNVPADERGNAKLYPLSKFSVEEIAAIHKQAGK